MGLDHEDREGGADRWDLADGENLQKEELVLSASLTEHHSPSIPDACNCLIFSSPLMMA